MKTIGLIGGMSWESTVTYYQQINEEVKRALGGLHSAQILLYSVDFAPIEAWQAEGAWDKSAEVLRAAAQTLEAAGADCVVICTNTMHKVAGEVAAGCGIPLLHIAQATAEELLQNGVNRVGLLGTKYTMTQDFYKDVLIRAGLEVLIPGEEDVEQVNRVIFEELCLGRFSEESRAEFLRIIGELAERGAQGIVLGCTEIGLLIRQDDATLPLFDTAQIHAQRAAQWALQEP